jgi:hypothetical protein
VISPEVVVPREAAIQQGHMPGKMKREQGRKKKKTNKPVHTAKNGIMRSDLCYYDRAPL